MISEFKCVFMICKQKNNAENKVSFSLLHKTATEYDGEVCGGCHAHSDSWRKLRVNDSATSCLPR